MTNDPLIDLSVSAVNREFSAWFDVLNNLEVGVTVISPDLTIEYINDTYRKIVDIPNSIECGMPAYELYHYMASRGDYGEGDPAMLAQERVDAMSDGTWSDAVHKMKNGRSNKIRRTVVDGGFIVTTITDISEIRNMENEASEKEALMSSVLDSINHGVMIVDNDACGAIELCNTACREMFGPIEDINAKDLSYYDYIHSAWKSGRFSAEGINDLDDEEFLARILAAVEKSDQQGITIELTNGKFVQLDCHGVENNRKIFTFTDITDSKNREIEVEKARKKSDASLTDFDTAINNMEVGLVLLDAQLNTLVINDAFHEMWNTSPEKFRDGCNFRDLMDINRSNDIYDVKDDEWEEYIQSRLNELRAGKIEPREFVRADGKTLIYSCIPLTNGQRLVRYSDITEFKNRENDLDKAQQAAENTAADFGAAINNMDVGLLLLDGDLKALMVNDPFYEIWRTNPEEFPVGANVKKLMEINRRNNVYPTRDEDWSDEDWGAYVDERLSAVRAGTIAADEFHCTDGRVFVFSCTALSDGQRLIRYTNITDYKNREAELSKAQQKAENTLSDFAAALNSLDYGVMLLDRDLNTVIINSEHYKLWNLDPENCPTGTNVRALIEANRNTGIYDIGEQNWDEYVKGCLEELVSGPVAPREFVRNDGKTLIYSCTELSDGQRLVTYSDVTEFKTREVALEQSQMLAESADRSKSEFLANMSHEIRTPMNGVMGMAELLGKTDLNSKQKMFTDVILSSSTALLTIINDILDFSKIEAGKLELDPAPFCLSQAIEDVATLVSSAVTEKSLELIVRVQPGLADNVIGDAGRYRQILTNLVGNAVKFTEQGHVLVDVSGTERNGIVTLKCSVQDTGIGIPEDQVEKVFEKFSQVDGTSTRRHEGTGLGLAITTSLVSLMGGSVGCESVVGAGSTFWFTADFPIDTDAVKIPRMPVDISGARLLAIDDNPVNRSILLEQFDAWRLQGSAVGSGLEGLAMLRKAGSDGRPFELVVLDYHMPEMNGIDVARVIRSDAELKNTPIIMLTSVDNVSESANFKALDIDGSLTKPARASQLLEEIADVLRRKRASGQQDIEIAHNVGSDTNVNQSPPVEQQLHSESSTQTITTPIRTDELVQTENAAEPEPSKPETQHDLQSRDYILVVEDNEVNQMVFSQILDYRNLDFKIVENGKLAVDEVQKSHPKLILMDISMPVMNGIEATGEIRRLFGPSGSGQSPIIIGVTAHALKDDRESCIAAGMDDYMSKPISPDMLIEKICKWLPELELPDEDNQPNRSRFTR